jgi:oxygen-independent coproporphyrinogen-3 oxidase
MPGIYIHIPFCRQACYYCNFHFSTSLKNKKEFLAALKKEIELQKDYLQTKNISTVYLGGGTPSLLSKEEILEIFDSLSKYFFIGQDAEITLEANPDDLSKEKLSALAQTPVNRLSIGIQSFSAHDLKFLNRIHSAKDGIEAVKNAREAGFKNISIDLIYGIPTLTNEQWKKNIHTALALDVQHISCYALTVEEKTALYSYIKKKTVEAPDEERIVQQFEILMDEMEKNNFIHYEISNFCREGFYSKHNTSYWKGEKYLGLGPSAHSYDGKSRQWNVSSNAVYIQSIKKGIVPFEKELLTETQKLNEYILTSLRTMWGMDMREINGRWQFTNQHQKIIEKMIEENFLKKDDSLIFLTRKGKLFADKVTRELFV